MAAHSNAVASFRALHASGCFVLPNPWDVGSARYLEHLGFKVESVDAVKKELAVLRESDPQMCERIIAEPSEGERRTALIAGCRHGQHVASSPDGVFVDILQR